MTTQKTAATEPTPTPEPSKSDIVKRLLARRSGATIEEIGAATNWQPHSTRAFLSGLRKKGSRIGREERRNGVKAYRITKADGNATAE